MSHIWQGDKDKKCINASKSGSLERMLHHCHFPNRYFPCVPKWNIWLVIQDYLSETKILLICIILSVFSKEWDWVRWSFWQSFNYIFFNYLFSFLLIKDGPINMFHIICSWMFLGILIQKYLLSTISKSMLIMACLNWENKVYIKN